MAMDVATAKVTLQPAQRFECVDFAFGDCEFQWWHHGELIAMGYRGGKCREFSILHGGEWHSVLEEADVDQLLSCGTLVARTRNDAGGE